MTATAFVGIVLAVFIIGARFGKFLSSVDITPQPSPRVTNVDIKEGDRIVVCPHCHRPVSWKEKI